MVELFMLYRCINPQEEQKEQFYFDETSRRKVGIVLEVWQCLYTFQYMKIWKAFSLTSVLWNILTVTNYDLRQSRQKLRRRLFWKRIYVKFGTAELSVLFLFIKPNETFSVASYFRSVFLYWQCSYFVTVDMARKSLLSNALFSS